MSYSKMNHFENKQVLKFHIKNVMKLTSFLVKYWQAEIPVIFMHCFAYQQWTTKVIYCYQSCACLQEKKENSLTDLET